ncbi:hypothetical protein MK851_00025 [Tenacibaculum sp. 1B UA]|uniref:hypothetical protein n=1 Tax=Tenacibaculum sp. 1B UA TaxID=2922252 RepID=UPI002A240C59|nr:hypothetical protein [Tenacibaculum sp. 1B UA]MDX8552013.1 hypothetical protein [Tenacibaculum sp. 1B UA]
MKKIILIVITILIASCGALNKNSDLEELNKRANRVTTVMKGYQPIDPIQLTVEKENDTLSFKDIISEFPNEATRVAVGRVNQSGSLTFGTFNVARNGESYSVIIDYIKYITTAIPARYSENYTTKKYADYVRNNYNFLGERLDTLKIPDNLKSKNVLLSEQILSTNYGSVNEFNAELQVQNQNLRLDKSQNHNIKIPVYVGIGLRIQASVTVLKDSVNLGSLYGLGVAASQNRLSGTLIIQSLGISGENVSPIIPIPDRINESTIQTAMQSLATIKSKIYDTKTKITPQVVAFGLPYSINGAKDLIESSLHTSPPKLGIKNTGEITLFQETLKEKKE